ncbi:hypothetical protein AZ019_004481, partial [Klebsiella pneumoniae]
PRLHPSCGRYYHHTSIWAPKVTSLSSPRLEVKAPLPLLSFVCRPEVLL